MKTCKDCIYRAMCYKHEHYGYEDNETCEMFKNKADFVEVVRCKECKHSIHGDMFADGIACLYKGCFKSFVTQNSFCSNGEKR